MITEQLSRPFTDRNSKRTRTHNLMLIRAISKECDKNTWDKIKRELKSKEFEFKNSVWFNKLTTLYRETKFISPHLQRECYLTNKGFALKRSYVGPIDFYHKDKIPSKASLKVELINQLKNLSKTRKKLNDICRLNGINERSSINDENLYAHFPSSPFLLVGSPDYKEMIENRRIRESNSKVDITTNSRYIVNVHRVSSSSPNHSKFRNANFYSIFWFIQK